uniref:(northern house mosquito) hypothetical protein n=1 Tax=Culex pipiens TaxID=7175 RepID=A0A8D8EVV1_CULPI
MKSSNDSDLRDFLFRPKVAKRARLSDALRNLSSDALILLTSEQVGDGCCPARSTSTRILFLIERRWWPNFLLSSLKVVVLAASSSGSVSSGSSSSSSWVVYLWFCWLLFGRTGEGRGSSLDGEFRLISWLMFIFLRLRHKLFIWEEPPEVATAG